MKITIPRDALRRALEAVNGAVATRTTLPALTTVKLEAENDQLKVQATDLNTSLTLRLPCETEADGAVCIPAKRLLDIAKAAPAGPVTISAEGTKVRVKAGKAAYNLYGLETDEFPDPPALPPGTDHIIRAGDLWSLLAQVGFCASTEETRPILNGVLWEVHDGSMTMVATNGHRLARYAIPVAVLAGVGGGEPEATSVIVHPRSLQLGRAIFDDEDEVSVSLSDRYVLLRSESAELAARLIEGPYPNYEQVIPVDNDKGLLIDRDALVAAVKRVAIVANDDTRRVILSLGPDGVHLTAKTPDAGDATDQVAGDYQGAPMEIASDAKYLLEMLPRIPTDTIRITLKGSERAITVHPTGDDAPDLLNLIMPIRILEDSKDAK